MMKEIVKKFQNNNPIYRIWIKLSTTKTDVSQKHGADNRKQNKNISINLGQIV